MQLAADARIDLQLHTIYSDGLWKPEELLDYLKQEGFAAAAITDHDRVDTIESLQGLARERGFLLLPAVEMSTSWRGEPVDMLCYGIDRHAGSLYQIAEQLLQRQQENIRQTCAAIAQQGYPLPAHEVQRIIEQPAVQQPHSLVRLVKQHGYESPTRSAGRLLVDAGLEILTTAIEQVVTATHEDGGVCLIAHPGRGDGYVNFDEHLLDQLRSETLIDGFEVFYPAHSPQQIAMYLAYAEKYDLLTSAGSDSHTPESPPIPYRADTSTRLLCRLGFEIV